MKRYVFCIVALFFLIRCGLAFAQKEVYEIDLVHSSVTFKIRHFFSKVTGSFNQFQGTITADRENMERSTAEASIDMVSIDTNNEKRDGHLRSPDFFDAAQFPKMTFQSKKWKQVEPDLYEVVGDFTLRGITKEVVLKVKSLGFGEGMEGVYLSGWEATATIKKSDYGMTYGGKALGDDVEVSIQVEARRQ